MEGFAILDLAYTSWGYSILDVITKYIVTMLIVIYVTNEPSAITGGADWGTSVPVVPLADD